MKLSEFDYHLPQELIAQTPIEPRDHSRLLVLEKETGNIEDKHFYNLLEELGENDILVLNKTKVINARLIGYITKPNNKDLNFGNIEGKLPESQSMIGGVFEGNNSKNLNLEKAYTQVEIFLHKQISENTWDCLVYPGKKLKIGKKVEFKIESKIVLEAVIKEVSDKGRIIEFSKGGVEFLEIVEKLGQVPLPPYIKEKLEDSSRYQTVFNEISGSVAAPTAGLHFTPELIKKLEKKGVVFEKVLLHVGLGTFMGVETENILDHKMHSEYIELEKDVAERLNAYKQAGKRIIAVGTTSIRVLESFTDEVGILSSGNKETSIFIYPGYTWKFVDAIITNFHLPKSTLMMLVSSFAGKQNTKKAYDHAINSRYRFFSFGDTMFIK